MGFVVFGIALMVGFALLMLLVEWAIRREKERTARLTERRAAPR
jgi:hypothetical protein